MTVGPSLRMSAPMRLSSATCMKRSGKIFSVMMLLPSARHSRAMNWACRSVGKPGYGWVVTSVGSRRRAEETTTPPLSCSTITPISRELVDDGHQVVQPAVARCVTSPLVMAAAIMNVPASMRSGMTGASQPCELLDALDDDPRRAGAGDLGAAWR